MSLKAHLVVIVLAAVLLGCGDDEREPVAGTATAAPTETATATPSPTATAATATATATATPTATAKPQEGGDEEGNRVPFDLTLNVEDVTPAEIHVPAFLGLRATVKNESGRERRLELDGKTVLEILPGATEKIDLEGLSPGTHRLDAGESGRAEIVAERSGE